MIVYLSARKPTCAPMQFGKVITMTGLPTGQFSVIQDAEAVRGRVAGAILTKSPVTIDLVDYGEISFRVRGTNHEDDSTVSLVDGLTAVDKQHITIHLHDDGRATAHIV